MGSYDIQAQTVVIGQISAEMGLNFFIEAEPCVHSCCALNTLLTSLSSLFIGRLD